MYRKKGTENITDNNMFLYWVRLPGEVHLAFKSIREARIHIERAVGGIANQFEIAEEGIEVRGLIIRFYVGGEDGEMVRPLDEKELKYLDNRFYALQNIGKTKISIGDVSVKLREMKQSWNKILYEGDPKRFDYEHYLQYFLSIYLETSGIHFGSKEYIQIATDFHRLLAKIRNKG